jgi:Cu/Ag efflux protein CusF
MKFNLLLIAVLAGASCSSPSTGNNVNTKPTPFPSIAAPNSPNPVTTASRPKDGDYRAKGVVTKIDPAGGSVEINHEEIKDMMPAMQMEFFVSDKKLLNNIKVGDKVDFVVRYKDPTETVVDIKKTQ